MEAPAKTLSDYWEILSRRRLVVVSVAALASGAALLFALSMPRFFRSSATLLLEAPLPKTVIETTTLVEYAEDRIKSITQKVMTSDTISRVVHENGIYQEDEVHLPESDLVKRFKDDTEIRIVKSDLGGKETQATSEIAFTIAFLHTDPDMARRVVSSLANLCMAQNDRDRTQKAVRTAQFLAEEADRLNLSIQEIDGRISKYKSRFRESLPENLQNNLAAIGRTEDELRDIDHQVRLAKDRMSFLSIEIDRVAADKPRLRDDRNPLTQDHELKSLKARYLEAMGRYYPHHPDVVSLRRQLESLDPSFRSTPGQEDIGRRLEQARLGLQVLEAKSYGEQHPDMAKLRREIQGLESQSQNRSSPSAPMSPEEAELSTVARGLKAQLKSTQMELDYLMGRKQSLQVKQDQLEKRINVTPEVERGYLELTRERTLAAAKYDQLKQKLQDARLVQTMEEEQNGRTLTLIEQPSLPLRPEKMVRHKIAIGGSLFGLALGVFAALLLESLNPRIRGYRSVIAHTGLMPLAVIPYLETPDEIDRKHRGQQRRKLLVLWAGAAGLLAAVLAAWSLFPPLPDLLRLP